jgi:hypothetical protein
VERQHFAKARAEVFWPCSGSWYINTYKNFHWVEKFIYSVKGVLRNQFQFETTETSFETILNKMFVSVVSLQYRNNVFRCFD